jgi:hypothetical protein
VIFPMRAIRPAGLRHPVDPKPYSNRADDSIPVGAVVAVQEFRRHSGRVVVVIQGVYPPMTDACCRVWVRFDDSQISAKMTARFDSLPSLS